MDYTVILSPSAQRDLQDIVRYISFDNSEYAIKLGRFLITKIKLLKQFPEVGRVVPEFENHVIREIIVRSYRIIYRVNHLSHKIEIIRFWHGKRGAPDLHIEDHN